MKFKKLITGITTFALAITAIITPFESSGPISAASAESSAGLKVVTEDGMVINDDTNVFVDVGTSHKFSYELSDSDESNYVAQLTVENNKNSKYANVSVLNELNSTTGSFVVSATNKDSGTKPTIITIDLRDYNGEVSKRFSITILQGFDFSADKSFIYCGPTPAEDTLTFNQYHQYQFNLNRNALSSNLKATDGIVWSVSNASGSGDPIAEIDPESGLLTANGYGRVIIKATALNKHLADAEENGSVGNNYGLNVRTEVATREITITKANPITAIDFKDELFVGGSTALSIEAKKVFNLKNYIDATLDNPKASSTDDYVWSTSNSNVATIDSNGVITAVGKGQATVTVTIDSINAASVQKSLVVYVYNKVGSIKLSADTKTTFLVGNEVTFEVIESPDSANEELVWSVADPSIAEVTPLPYDVTSNKQYAVIKGISAGSTTVTVKTNREDGEENVSLNIPIEVRDAISEPTIKVADINDVVYSGDPQAIAPVVTDKAGNVLSTKYYTVKYSNDTRNVGVVTVTVTGSESNGHYGTIEKTYRILPKPVDELNYLVISAKDYNFGKEIKPLPTIKYGASVLTLDTDYSVAYSNNIDAGDATITVSGIGNYTGTLEIPFNIVPLDISKAVISGETSFVYTSNEITPEYKLTMSSVYDLVEDTDYTVSYSNNINVGKSTAIATFTANGNFKGTAQKKFTITKKNVKDDIGGVVEIEEVEDQGYMGGMPIEPTPEVTYNGNVLAPETDYIISYSNNSVQGKATITFNFSKSANYSGTLTKEFEIVNRTVTKPAETIKFFDPDGKEIANETVNFIDKGNSTTVLVSIAHEEGCDDAILTATTASNKNATAEYVGYSKDGSFALIKITGKQAGSYEIQFTTQSGGASRKLFFTILEPATKIVIKQGSDDVTTGSGSGGVFIAENHQTKFTAVLTPTKTTDKVEWSVDNTELAEITQDGLFTAKKNGTVVVSVKVLPSETSERGLTATTSVTIKKANPITELFFPDVEMTLKPNMQIDAKELLKFSILDASNSTTDNLTWSTSDKTVATVDPITGLVKTLNKQGSTVISVSTDSLTPIVASFTLNVEIPATALAFNNQNYNIYTGEEQDIKVVFTPSTVNENLEFTVDDPSVAKIISSEYDQSVKGYLVKVKALKQGSCKITATTTRQPNKYEPEPQQISATAGITVTDKISVSNASVTLSLTEAKYTGKAIEPKATVKYNGTTLTVNKDYTIQYSDNVKPGDNAKVIITGVGPYTGVITKTFRIKYDSPNVTVTPSAFSVSLKWSKAGTGSGYTVERSNGGKWEIVADIKNISTVSYKIEKLVPKTAYKFRVRVYSVVNNETVYGDADVLNVTTKESTVSGFKASSIAETAVTLSWTKNSDCTGYNIERFNSSKNKWEVIKTITSNATVSFNATGLKAGTSYKFRICTSKDGKYGTYSTITVNTKASLAAPTGLKLKGRANNALRIAWNKNTSANGYIVEMYKGNKWVQVTKITKNTTTEWKQTGLAAGTAYKFRVKAYKMDGKTAVYSSYATISARTNPSNVTGMKTLGRAKTAVRFGWKKNTSADGYIVEMYKNGKWVRAAKIAKNSTVEFKKTGLKANTTYKFRIRAYKMSGKTALYSGYTNYNIATTK